MKRDACPGVATLRRVLVAAVLAACALGVLPPAARADGDPGSDVLVYQNLFVAADANVSVPQQLELGNLLTRRGQGRLPGQGGDRLPAERPGRDHGAVEQAGRLRELPRHRVVARVRAAAADRDAERVRVQLAGALRHRGLPGARRSCASAPGGAGLATAARERGPGARRRPRASGSRSPPRAAGARGQRGRRQPARAAAASGGAAQGPRRGGQPAATSAPSGSPVPLIAGIALAVLARRRRGRLAAAAPLRGGRPAAAAAAPPAGWPGSGGAGPPSPAPGWRAASWAWRSLADRRARRGPAVGRPGHRQHRHGQHAPRPAR